MRACVLLVAAFMPFVPGSILAQDSNCTYDGCALRLQYGLFGTQTVVQGAGATPVVRLTFFTPGIPTFDGAGEPVSTHYRRFRQSRNAGTALSLVGVFVTAASLIRTPSDGFPPGAVAGGALSLGGLILLARSNEALQQVVWHYNRSLAPSR